LNPLLQQDRSRWDARLVEQGLALLERSASGDELTAYHVEAAIAALHAAAPDVNQIDWTSIVSLYDRLMSIAPSPVVALNRAIAIAERDGAARGLTELGAIADRDRLEKYLFYPATLGELELRQGHRDAARTHFRAALALARNQTEKQFFERRLRTCEGA
jgi:RNA polymerase sigma-70 factor (ECF subfamily)